VTQLSLTFIVNGAMIFHVSGKTEIA